MDGMDGMDGMDKGEKGERAMAAEGAELLAMPRVCPLIMTAQGQVMCVGECCAWFVGSVGQCAVAVVAGMAMAMVEIEQEGLDGEAEERGEGG